MKYRCSDELLDKAMKVLILYMRYNNWESFSDYVLDYLEFLEQIYKGKLDKYKGEITRLLFLERK